MPPCRKSAVIALALTLAAAGCSSSNTPVATPLPAPQHLGQQRHAQPHHQSHRFESGPAAGARGYDSRLRKRGRWQRSTNNRTTRTP